MELVVRPSKAQLERIKRIASESFADDDLFASFGTGRHRHEMVARYMDCYVDFVVRQKVLWANGGFDGFVALLESHTERFLPTTRMLHRLRRTMPEEEYGDFLAYGEEISNDSDPYKQRPYLEMLMLCVDPERRGMGLGKELVRFSQSKSAETGLPLAVDTDMPGNARMYQHLGCDLVGTRTGSNGITRYNLVWYPPDLASELTAE